MRCSAIASGLQSDALVGRVAELLSLGGVTTRMAHKLTKLFRETWFFWLYCICLGVLTGRETDAAPIPRRAELLSGFAFALLVAMWVNADARRRQRAMSYGYPALVFVLWPIFAPIYLFQTRGVRAFLSLLSFIAIVLVTAGLGVAIGIMTQH
jgi:hypothetical protein